MEEHTGYIASIRFRNDENGYTVFDLEEPDGGEITCVGHFPFINEGEYVRVTGELTIHPIYQEQLKVSDYEITEPDGVDAILKFLSSGAVKGIRGGLAKRIVDNFGERTFDVMEKHPEELALIKGISDKKAREIASSFSEMRGMRRAVIFLQKYGIALTLAVKIYKYYGDELFDVVEKNPYRLAEDIQGVGFKKADEIAVKAGFLPDSLGRIRAGLIYALNLAAAEGHVYLPEDELVLRGVELLGVSSEQILDVIAVMVIDKVLVMTKPESPKRAPAMKQTGTGAGDEAGSDVCRRIYLPSLNYAELDCARALLDLNISFPGDEAVHEKTIKTIEKREGIELDDLQRTAVSEAIRNGVTVITGGPGTGKTTTINTLMRVLMNEGYHILLAAPTGRAAKRMSEATGYPAQTIHRLLEYSGGPGDDESFDREAGFQRNRDNPLETDVVIVDEMSMVDIFLFSHLLKALNVGTRLILVGDVDQLPSVGPGNVLKDIISSHCFNVVKLTKIFRQAMESDIVMNAHRILSGQEIDLHKNKGDFFFAACDTPKKVIDTMLFSLVKSSMAEYFDCEPFDMQILSPMKKGELGVIHCNELLQKYLNPPSPQKHEIVSHDVTFREGDKVMQIKNNYRMKYRILGYNGIVVEEGEGVFNGDIGVIKTIDTAEKQVEVIFDDEKHVTYAMSELSDLEPAYAVTVHKSQGSEYPVVILPLFSGPAPLMTRNILYTALTRGRRCVMIIGREDTVNRMIANVSENKRYSSLAERLA
ncbi:MAG: ATP-dependent RecD-like DNA helicase [Eubacterium sp.]|nr:ATP-dependent RecD-like DNA helicase [Eubacterium sp.]